MEKRVAFKNLAVLLIDMQERFIDTREKFALIPQQLKVLNFCRENSILTIFFEYLNYGATNPRLLDKLKKMSYPNVFYFIKTYDDAFTLKEFSGLLGKREITTLVLMGINAGFCVYSTSKSAINRGYKILTSADLIAGYESEFSCPDSEWYESNGVYVKDHSLLLKKLSGL